MMCCLWKETPLFIGLQKRGIMDKIIVSANFFLVLTRIGLSKGFLTTFLKDDIRSALMKQVGNRYSINV